MSFTLHRAARHVARICSTDKNMNSCQGVHVIDSTDTPTVEASDGKRLLRLEFKHPLTPEDFPTIKAMESAPNSAAHAIVPAKAYVTALKAAPSRGPITSLRHALVSIGEESSTFGTTDLETTTVTPIHNIEGRFPDTLDMLTSAEKDPKAFTCTFDARLLGELLLTMADILEETDPDSKPAVKLEFREPTTALRLTAGGEGREDSPTLTALAMPCFE
jgi:hypothetical protein